MSKTMSRRNFLKAAALTGVGAALAACSAPAAAPTATSASVAPTGAAPASTIEGTIKVFAQGAPVTPVCNQIAAVVKNKFPKLTVKMDLWDGTVDKIYTAAAAGTLDDVFFNADGFVVPFANNNVTLDLKPLATADPEMNLDDIFPAMLGLGTFGGKIMMFPEALDVVTMYYNKDLLTKAGAEMPKDTWTWDDFTTNMKKVVAISKNAQGVPDYWGLDNQTYNWWATVIPFIYGHGGKVWDPATKKSTWSTDPKTVEGLTAYLNMWTKDNIAEPIGTDVGGQAFLLGKAAVYTHIEALRPTVRTAGKAIPFDWDVQLMPKHPDGKHHTGMGCWGLSVYSKSKMIPAAYQFAKTLISPAMQLLLAQQELAVPLVKSVANDPSWMTGLPTPPTNMMAFVTGANDADLPPVDFPAGCGSVYDGIVNKAYLDAIEKVLRSNTPVQQAFAAADTTIQACLDSAK